MKKIAEEILREKMEKKLAKEKVQMLIARDRADYEARRNKSKAPQQPVAPSVAPWNSLDHLCRLQVA